MSLLYSFSSEMASIVYFWRCIQVLTHHLHHSSLLLPYTVHLSMNTLVCFSWTILGMIISLTWTLWPEVTQSGLLFCRHPSCCFSGPHFTDFSSKLNLVYVLLNSNVIWADLFLIDGVSVFVHWSVTKFHKNPVDKFPFFKGQSVVVENEFKAHNFYRPFSWACGYLLPAVLTCSDIFRCSPSHQEDEQDPSLSAWSLYSICKNPKFLSKRVS